MAELGPRARNELLDSPVQLPRRYDTVWDAPFREAVMDRLVGTSTILDIGSGRNPTLLPAERPPDTTYVGLDVSIEELEAAAPGGYDGKVVADAGALQDTLIGKVDLALSWQVLEHVPDLGATATCLRAYLRPGGTFIAFFSGSRSAFAVANRVLPIEIGRPLVSKIMKRSASRNPVFPAYYDRCYASGLRRVFRDWSDVQITPFYRGAEYFRFSKTAMSAYLAYEDLTARAGMENLATHYLLVAHR